MSLHASQYSKLNSKNVLPYDEIVSNYLLEALEILHK